MPQFILDDYISKGMGSQCRIICTQPRRISAISVSHVPLNPEVKLHRNDHVCYTPASECTL